VEGVTYETPVEVDCRMTNLVSLANKLLWYLNELLDFLGHYAKGTMKDRRVRVRWCVCVDRKVLF